MVNIGYVALYRKYRPKAFLEVVGQEHITKTLKNQVKTNKVAHAYLFNGPRGTGKTSIAKILSRAVNCLDTVDGDPCNKCEICKGIMDGSIMDVIEIDAASNNSVDNVRDIRDEIVYTPSKARMKVYIIDEVHMLSTGAFNALLKTLEEPPQHVLFILATTEPHKLPATIISRCQRFDFKKISSDKILERLKDILKDVDVKLEEKALELISRLCEGGMRDALSLLDQSISLGKEVITHSDVLAMVGMVDNDILFDLSDSIKSKNITKAISIVDTVYTQGKDLNNFLVRLLNHYRNLLMIKTLDNTENLIDLSDDDIKRLKESVNQFTTDEIISIIALFSETLNDAKKTNFTKILLETAIIKLCKRENVSDNDMNNLIERINKLENIINSGTIIKRESVENKTINKAENKKVEQKAETVKIEVNSKEHIGNDKESLAKHVSSNWIKVLDDMRAKGFSPLKLQYLNNVVINPFAEGAVMAHLELKEDIGAKIIEEKRFVGELKDSLVKVTGKEIDIRFNIKKNNEVPTSEIDSFKELVMQRGMGQLINEI